MKKSRIYLLIIIPVIALYLGSCFVMFQIARSNASDLFQSAVENDFNVTYDAFFDDSLSNYNTPYSYVSYLADTLGEDTYSYQYQLVYAPNTVSEPELVASSGSRIILSGLSSTSADTALPDLCLNTTDLNNYNETDDILYIAISGLLTEQMRAFLLDTDNVDQYGLRSSNFLYELSYYTEDHEIIPVSLTFQGLWFNVYASDGTPSSVDTYISDDHSISVSENGRITFTFSDHIADNTLHIDPNSGFMTGSIVFDSLDCAYNGSSFSDTSAKIREDFADYLSSSDNQDLLSLSAYGETLDQVIYDWNWREDTANTLWNVKVNGTTYILAMTIGVDLYHQALSSSAFREYVFGAGGLFLNLMIIALFVAGCMYEKNRKLNEARLAFTSAVAHELKTPLAVIQSQCECIMEGVAPEKNQEYLSTIYREARGMNRMVLSFLQYNRLAMAEKIEMSQADLSALIREETEKYLPMLEDEERMVTVEIEDQICGMVNPDLLRLAVDNFLSNAAKYTTPVSASENGQIHIHFERKGKGFRFRIMNTCDTRQISTSTVWNILTKADASRHRDKNSTGMGLPVAAEILKLHRMKYECRPVIGGIEFCFERDV